MVSQIKIPGFLLLALAACGTAVALGNNEAVNWRVWNTDDGMIEAYIPQITRGPAGQLVVRHGDVPTFDVIEGLRFSKLPDIPSLGRIVPDGAGSYITFDKSGILVLKNGKWTRFPLPELENFPQFGMYKSFGWFDYAAALDEPSRVSLAVAGPGHALLTFAEKLIGWTEAGGAHVLREAAGSGIGSFVDITAATNGVFFVCGTKGFAFYEPATGHWTPIAGPSQFSRFVFPSVTPSGDVLMTVDGADHRKRLVRYSRGTWTVVYTGSSKLRGWEADGRVWIMETGRLLSVIDGVATEVNIHPQVSGRLMDAAPEGDTFWLSSMQGVARYARPMWRAPVGAPELDVTVNSIAQDARGALWFGSGRSIFSLLNGVWRSYLLPNGEAEDAGKTGAVCPLDNGHVLLLTENTAHIFDMDVATGRFRVIPHPEHRAIKWIDRRDGKTVWVQSLVAGEHTSRIEIFDGHTFTKLPGAEAIPTTDVRTLLLTRSGRIWIGGTGALMRLSGGKLHVMGPREGAPEQSGFSILEGRDGTVYVGHRDAITSFDGTRFHVLRRGMDRIRRLVEGPDGSLWAASGIGVHHYRNGSWITNALDEGLPSSAAVTVFIDRDQHVWAGTTLGLSTYHPESDLDPPTTWIHEDQNLRQAPPGGEVRFAFSGMDRWKQTPQARLLFSWRTDNGSWSAFSGETLVAVRALRSGRHFFEVRAMDRNGNIDPHPAGFHFEVLLPWYRESGFYLVACILAGAIALLLRSAFAYHRNLRFQSRHDSLTSLPNRLHFEEALAAALDRPAGAGGSIAVLFVDLDGFKSVNDNLGHLAGDKLLVTIGARLRSRLRRGDLLARLGGDEFAILLPNVRDRDAVAHFADEVLQIVRGCSPGASWKVAASVGISLAPEHGTSPHVLVRLADLAMYQSKSRSGDCRLFYEPGMKVDFRGAEVAGIVRTALREERLVLWYQPIVNRDRNVVRMEALVRINDPEIGIIAPGAFIGVAEETGLIDAIGHWVLREAARTARLWRQSGCCIPIAVNVSPVQLERPELSSEVLAILSEYNLPPSALTIEITESAIARNQEMATATLSALRAAGISISLDDFGTGYSALSMLDGMPLDELKLDRSFAASLASERTRDVIYQTVKLARNLNVTVVAEGIEETSQLETAIELGCDHFQGFLIAPPLERNMATRFVLSQPVGVTREALANA